MNLPRSDADRQVRLVLTAVFLVYLAQMSLNPVIAPLAREVDLAEWQIGVTISTAALMVVATSQTWGRRSQSWGRKPVLVAAFGLAVAAMIAFAVVARLGMTGALAGAGLFAAFLVLRGLMFGAAIAAVGPTAQAYIADVTVDEAARVKGMAGVGAVQGVAMVAGAVVGGALSAFGLMTPLVAVPLLLVIGLVVIGRGLRREDAAELVETPLRVRPTDPRVWPFLLAGFGMFTSLGFVQVLIGFIVQDRLDVSEPAAGVWTGGALLAAGVGMIVAQAVVVPRSGWSPAMLLRVGTAVALGGFVLMLPDLGSAPLVIAVGVIGLGLGTAMPGYTAGPSMVVERAEQGALAGLIGATNGLTFVVAPTLGTALYGWAPAVPIVASIVVMGLVLAFVALHPRFARVDDRPAVSVDEAGGPDLAP